MKNRITLRENLSANSLFHFTSSKENLLGILRNNFYPRYSPEDLCITKSIPSPNIFGIPMVSFCDIPLSQIRNHIQTYGHYALGLTKAWAKLHGITPVMYFYPDSQSAIVTRDLFRTFLDNIQSNQVGTNIMSQLLTYSSFFQKQYEGKLFRNGKFSEEVVRFYDEREWRFVPPWSEFANKPTPPYLKQEDVLNPTELLKANRLIEQFTSIPFEPRYIRYLIVDKEAEILEFIDEVLNIKGANYSHNDLKILTTRIVSIEQILDDY